MGILRDEVKKLSGSLRQRTAEPELDEEVQFHIDMQTEKNLRLGMSPDEARRKALVSFGGRERFKEEARDEYRSRPLEDLVQDLRYGVRSALRAPLFSLLAVLTLALGIGANAAVFGVVKSVLLDALPYADADRLMRLYGRWHDGMNDRGPLSVGTMIDVATRQRSFSQVAAFEGRAREAVFSGDANPVVAQVAWVQPAFFATLGVPAAHGRVFREEDAAPDTALSIIVTHAAWQRLFGGDAGVVGRGVRINGVTRTIVGVLPRGFVGPLPEIDFYFAMNFRGAMRDPVGMRRRQFLGAVARLKPGVTVEAARRDMAVISADLAREYPQDNASVSLNALPVRDAMVGETRAPLLVLLASAALVLLITCANLAGALLSRTLSRRKEFAVRVALGAGRGRLVRQLLTESTVLALAGGVTGLLLAMGGLSLLRGLALTALPTYADLSLDVGAVLVTFALALATGLGFGVGPALSVGRSDPQGTLREQTRGSSESTHTRRTRGLLVAGQIALCVSLLAAAGLLARSLWAMTTAPTGFNADKLLTFTVQLPNAKYGTAESRVLFHDQFEQRLRELPGVTGVAVTTELPTAVGNSNGLFIQDSPWAADEPVPFILTQRVSDGYFQTLGIPLKQGRVFTTADRTDVGPVIVINEAMAQRYWPKGNAVGARVHIGPPDPSAPWITVIGVVGNARNDPTSLRPEPMMFPALRQQPFGDTFAVRTSGDPLALVNTVRRTLGAMDPALPIHRVKTMRAVMDEGFASRRLPVVLMTSFGALALLLASVGVYAMFASMASAREREFGVRIAIGSSRGAIAALVLRQGGVWMAIGLGIGTIGVVLAARLLRTQLYGVPQFDPIAIGLAVLTLLVCAGVALLVPVRRASRVDPITVLR